MEKSLTPNRPCIFLQDSRVDLNNLTRRYIVKNSNEATRIAMYGSRKDFSIFHTIYKPIVMGERRFWHKMSETSLTFKNGRFYGSMNHVIASIIIQVFNLNWILEPWVKKLLALNKTLWAMILKGKITNPEMLAKKYSKLYFKGVFSYKALKLFFTSDAYLGTLWDLYYYTTNPNLCIEKYAAMDSWNNAGDLHLLRDTLYYAKIEGTKINPSWSHSRLSQEHQKQIEKDNLEKIASYPDELIATPYEKDGLELILSERAAFYEGNVMHNCIHSCYWHGMAEGHYLVARGVVEGTKIDVGINYNGYTPSPGSLHLSQVHSIYNGNVSDSVREFCEHWITANEKALINVIMEIKNSNNRDSFEPALPF